MADLGGTFDPGAVSDDREVLPAGDQLAQIFESDLVDNKNNTGKIAKFGWEIVSGPLQGRKLWTQENVQHNNAQAQEIGQRTLKRICEAAGVGPIRNTEELHFKPMTISIVVEPAEGQYGPKNGIKGYKFYGPPSRAPDAPSAPQRSQATNGGGQPPPAKAGSVPWPSR